MFGGGVGSSALSQVPEPWAPGARFSEATPPYEDVPIGIAATTDYVYKGIRHQLGPDDYRFLVAKYDLDGNLIDQRIWPDSEAVEPGRYIPHGITTAHVGDTTWGIFMVGEVPRLDTGCSDAAVVAFAEDESLSVAWSWIWMPNDSATRDERAVLIVRGESLQVHQYYSGFLVGIQSTLMEEGTGLRTRFMHTRFTSTLAFGRPDHTPRRFVGDPDWNDELVGIDWTNHNITAYLTGTSTHIQSGDTRILTIGYEDGELFSGFPRYVNATQDYTYTTAGIAAGQVDAAYVLGTRWPRPGNPALPSYFITGYHHDVTHFPRWSVHYGSAERANIASDIKTNETDALPGSQATVGELIHVTGTSIGVGGTKALTLQYKITGDPGDPFFEWEAEWPHAGTTFASEGMGVALSRLVHPPAGCFPSPPAGNGVFLAATARDGVASWMLGTMKYSVTAPFPPGNKIPDWEMGRDGNHGDDMAVGIHNWWEIEPLGQGCISRRHVWPIGVSAGPLGNDTSLATMYIDDP